MEFSVLELIALNLGSNLERQENWRRKEDCIFVGEVGKAFPKV